MGAFDDDADDTLHENPRRFNGVQEEIQHWKSEAQMYKRTLRDTESTLKDFEETSKEVEREMEHELNAANSKMNDLQVRSEKMKGEVDEWKQKYQHLLGEHNKSLAELNNQLTKFTEEHKIYKSRIRNMEMDNDELEKTERIVAASLEDMESRYNRAVEHTALLEGELIAKTKLEEENQRLKDELRETRDELEVWQEKITQYSNRSGETRTSHDRAGSNTNGRTSIDVDRPSYYRPASRTGVYDRPASRTGHSNPPPPASSSGAAARRSIMQARSSMATSQAKRGEVRSPTEGLTSSPSMPAFKPRQSVSGAPIRRPLPSGRVQQGSSMRKMAGLLQNLRDLQATVHTATRLGPSEAQQSAIPRPSSRLSSSIGPGAATPRRSIDVRREDALATPSAIPLPANGLSRSTSQRPSSRLSHQPSSVRSQTPNLENYASLDFLDRDPAAQESHGQRRRSHLATLSSGGASSYSLSQSVHGGNVSSITRPRGSTLSASTIGVAGSSGLNARREDGIRRAITSRTTRPVAPPPPPSVTLRHATMSIPAKARHSSMDTAGGKAF